MSNDELQALLAEWQETLRVRDWDISAGFVRRRALSESGDTRGETRFAHNWKRATIKLVVPDDFEDDDEYGPYDPEQTLVHELMHVVFFGFMPEDDDNQRMLFENGFELSACALVKLKRAAQQAAQEDTR
jgi:hypothetical protein